MNKTELSAIMSERRQSLLYLDICKLCDKHMSDTKRQDGKINKYEVRLVLLKLLKDELQKDV